MVRLTVEQHARLEVCDEAQDGAQAVRKARELKPDVVVLNVAMPVMNGFEAERQIKEQLPDIPIVILSSNADKTFVEEARKIGARAYVDKSRAAQSLAKAIEAAVKGEDFLVL